jgi:phosphomannomutase
MLRPRSPAGCYTARLVDETLARRVDAWIADDPDAASRAELRALLDRGAAAELEDRFGSRLSFGTAGLRGTLRAGPNGMNRAVVRRAAAGLAAYLGPGRSVVIGFDARHGSRTFAEDSAAVLAGAGLRARVFDEPLPTPVLAFAVRRLGADAGVMVTASHNPPQDNGYKVYLGGPGDEGAQIVPPADREIEAQIAAVPAVSALPLGAVERIEPGVVDAYVDATVALALTDDRDVRIVYTPLHGVGRATLCAVLRRAGVPAPVVEPAQAEPDPDFPTVRFPNPEEPGTLDRALALGRAERADVVIATDPDADRCAVAVGDRVLRGDELGAILGDHILRHRRGLVSTTIVSSSLLGRIAASYGVPYRETLTGFKWIMRAGPGLVYGYEEALGYAVGPDVVRDKDGISATLLVAEIAAGLRARGRTLLDRLDDLAREHGVFATAQQTAKLEAPARDAVMAALRARPPRTLGGSRVEEVEDLRVGPHGLPAADVVILRLGGARVVVRPSGTEPKIKAYLEVVEPVTGDLGAARAAAAVRLRALGGDVALLLAA